MNTTMMCSTCGAPALEGAGPGLQGLCPRCVMGFAMEAPDASPLPGLKDGSTLGSYEILGRIGKGGMGIVYRARHTRLDRIVALKVLSPAYTADAEFVARFQREAKALASLSHPNIVAIHDAGVEGDLPFLAMELVEGVSLRKLLAERRLPPEEALHIVPQLCDALEYAHQAGIVHRDIKPENILIDTAGRVKIADFGLAKVVTGSETGGHRLTQTNVAMGTPHYMAPEQVENPTRVDHRADIYSMGVVFYEMLTGELPIGRFAAPSKKAAVNSRLDQIVHRALEKDPADRYQRASEVKEDVTKLGTRDTWEPAPLSQPPSLWRMSVDQLLPMVVGIIVVVISAVVARAFGGKGVGELAIFIPMTLVLPAGSAFLVRNWLKRRRASADSSIWKRPLGRAEIVWSLMATGLLILITAGRGVEGMATTADWVFNGALIAFLAFVLWNSWKANRAVVRAMAAISSLGGAPIAPPPPAGSLAVLIASIGFIAGGIILSLSEASPAFWVGAAGTGVVLLVVGVWKLAAAAKARRGPVAARPRERLTPATAIGVVLIVAILCAMPVLLAKDAKERADVAIPAGGLVAIVAVAAVVALAKDRATAKSDMAPPEGGKRDLTGIHSSLPERRPVAARPPLWPLWTATLVFLGGVFLADVNNHAPPLIAAGGVSVILLIYYATTWRSQAASARPTESDPMSSASRLSLLALSGFLLSIGCWLLAALAVLFLFRSAG